MNTAGIKAINRMNSYKMLTKIFFMLAKGLTMKIYIKNKVCREIKIRI